MSKLQEKPSWERRLVRLWSDRLTGLSMAVLPKPPLEPVSAKLAYFNRSTNMNDQGTLN